MAIREHEYLIIGAGPAGLQLAHYLEEAGRDYAILEAAEESGSFFRRFPRHRTLLSINKRYTGRDDPEFNLRHDWNSLLDGGRGIRFGEHTDEYFPDAHHLVEYLQRYARELKLSVRHGVRVAGVHRDEERRFVLDTSDGRWRCRRLVVATGVSQPFLPDIPGIELAEGYEDMSLARDQYRNKAVLILGKGNSALETADHLVGTAAVIHIISPTPVRLAWDTRYVGDVRAVNNNFLDTYHLKSQNAVIDGIVHDIKQAPGGRLTVKFGSIHCNGETEEITYDHVLRCTGFRFDASIFDESCRPTMRHCGRLPQMTPAFESINVPDLFFAGVLTQALDYKRGQSAFIHGFRYNIRTLAALLAFRYDEVPLPTVELGKTSLELARAVLTRMSSVSSLWQQVGFLCDVVLDAEDEGAARLVPDLPYAYATGDARPRPPWHGGSFLVVCFRFGGAPENVFDHPRSADVFDGATSVAIHPVVERWRDGAKVDEFHVLEDFAADWTGDEYIESLRRYLDAWRSGQAFDATVEGEVRRDIVRGSDMRLLS